MEQEYQSRIDEMNARVENKLCLFEQAQVAIAKKKANKHVNDIILDAGLSTNEFE
jgi:hypothetical protein